jgi:ABC-type multidrug transport system, ATPase component
MVSPVATRFRGMQKVPGLMTVFVQKVRQTLSCIDLSFRFYSQLKQVPKDLAQLEISNMIGDLGIPHKRTSLANTLSGGMQRKLSVAMAFIGGSR